MMDLGFWELLAATLSAIFTIALIVLIIYSVFWFAFPKKKRTRWKVISGWYFFGVFLGVGNIYKMEGHPLTLTFIGYPLGVIIGLILWAKIIQAIRWVYIRVRRFFCKTE